MADLIVVDDDPDVADALAEVLLLEGHGVRIAYNGAEAIRLLDGKRADLVLLDVEMPVMDGPAAAYQMFLHNLGLEEIPVLLLSGVPDLSRIAKQVGTPYFVSKPFRYERLVEGITRALTERKAPVRPNPSRSRTPAGSR